MINIKTKQSYRKKDKQKYQTSSKKSWQLCHIQLKSKSAMSQYSHHAVGKKPPMFCRSSKSLEKKIEQHFSLQPHTSLRVQSNQSDASHLHISYLESDLWLRKGKVSKNHWILKQHFEKPCQSLIFRILQTLFHRKSELLPLEPK